MRPRQRWAWGRRAGEHRRSRLKRQLVGVSSTICIVEVPRTQLADRAERVGCLCLKLTVSYIIGSHR